MALLNPHVEQRWPVAVAMLCLLALDVELRGHLRLVPLWATWLIGLCMLVPLVGVVLSNASARWLAAEKAVVLGLSSAMLGVEVVTLADLVRQIADASRAATGMELLTSSAMVWAVVVVAFALIYWQVDNGGPARRRHEEGWPDWQFAQSAAGLTPPGWRPGFADYLFLAFSTSTAFSTTDTIPLTSRAKLLMMAQATMSLLTMVVIASRAINVLGS